MGVFRGNRPSPPRIILYKGSPSSFIDDLEGGIGSRYFGTQLIFFDKHVNSQTYMKYFLNNHVFEEFEKIFDLAYVWKQDNAPSHSFKYTQVFLSKIILGY